MALGLVAFAMTREGRAVKFGLMTQIQMPKPWGPNAEVNAYRDAIDQVAGDAANVGVERTTAKGAKR